MYSCKKSLNIELKSELFLTSDERKIGKRFISRYINRERDREREKERKGEREKERKTGRE